MIKSVVPFFTSEYSIGESVLTLKAKGKSLEHGPRSIVDLALKTGLDKVFLVENTMSGFLTAYTNLSAAKIQLCFGLKIVVCQDAAVKNDESRNTESKVIIFANGSDGYYNLLKIWNEAATTNFYYYPRTDSKSIAKHWDKKNVSLCLPFYSSFLANNTLSLSECMFDYSFATTFFSWEESGLPFDNLLRNRVENYAKSNSLPVVKTRSIYYDTYEDFEAFSVFRCIQNRSTLDKPDLNHFSSNKFCFQEFLKQNELPE